MAMKEVKAPQSGEEALRRIPAEPLSEKRARTSGTFYLHISDPAQAAALFRSVEKELAAMGFGCSYGSLQADPHPSLSVLGTFEVYVKGRREGELFGTVTIYGTCSPEPIPKTIQFDPVYPHDEETFRKALGLAVSKTLPDYSAAGSERDITLSLTSGPEPRPPAGTKE